jgi:hypothetical protein
MGHAMTEERGATISVRKVDRDMSAIEVIGPQAVKV